jgi:hypothetical protein
MIKKEINNTANTTTRPMEYIDMHP